MRKLYDWFVSATMRQHLFGSAIIYCVDAVEAKPAPGLLLWLFWQVSCPMYPEVNNIWLFVDIPAYLFVHVILR